MINFKLNTNRDLLSQIKEKNETARLENYELSFFLSAIICQLEALDFNSYNLVKKQEEYRKLKEDYFEMKKSRDNLSAEIIKLSTKIKELGLK